MLNYVSWKAYKAVTAVLKCIYQSAPDQASGMEMERIFRAKCSQIRKSWNSHWTSLITLIDYPEDISKAIYTTNAINPDWRDSKVSEYTQALPQ